MDKRSKGFRLDWCKVERIPVSTDLISTSGVRDKVIGRSEKGRRHRGSISKRLGEHRDTAAAADREARYY